MCCPLSNVLAAEAARGVGRDPRLQPQVSSLARVGQPGERSGQTGAIQVVHARDGRPVVDLVLPADAAAEVHAPDAVRAPLEAQRLERDADLRRPPGRIPLRGHGPHRVPARVDVPPFVRDLRVRFGARRIHDEDEPVAAIGERVEDHLEAVLLAGREVLADVVDDERGRRRVVADDADVERVVVVGDAHVGQLGRRLPFMRLGLHEVAGRLRRAPHLFVERAVERDWRARFRRAHHPAAIGRLELQRGVSGQGRAGAQQQRRKSRAPANGQGAGHREDVRVNRWMIVDSRSRAFQDERARLRPA